MKTLLKLVTVFVYAIWSAYVINILWSWFITPQWQIAAPRVIVLMGILMIKSLIFVNPKDLRVSNRDTDEEWMEDTVNVFMLSLVSLGIGWIYLWFM